MKVKLAYDVCLQGDESNFDDREAVRKTIEEVIKTKFPSAEVEYVEEIECEYEEGDPSFEDDDEDDSPDNDEEP